MYLKKLGIYIILMILLWTGCTKEDLGNSIAYEVILENHLSYAEVEIIPKQYLVFKNESDWNNFIPEIERVNPYHAEHLKSLNFDLNKNNLIIIIKKYYNNCCSKISIYGVYKGNEDAVVKYKESGPGMATAISQAYTLLKISKEEAD
jgi:hypothetical protein